MGEGDFFCAGGDLNALITAQQMDEDQRRARIDALNDLIRAVVHCPRPGSSPWSRGRRGAGPVAGAGSATWSCLPAMRAITAAYVNAGLVPDGGLTAALSRLPPQIAADMA